MKPEISRHKVGDLRPSQILFSFGIGSLVDLPNLSVMVMGADDWDTHTAVIALAPRTPTGLLRD